MTPSKSLLVVAVALTLVLAACGSGSGEGDDAGPASTTTSGSSATAVPADQAIGHVFVINLENESAATTFGDQSPARFLNRLASQGQFLSNYFGIGHASLDNYLAQISGQPPNPTTQGDCLTYVDFESTGTTRGGIEKGEGCVYPASVQTLPDQMETAGLTWRGYMEDMGTPCRHPQIGEVDTTQVARDGDQYAARHNPFVYFHSIIDDRTSCREHVVDLTELPDDLTAVDQTQNLTYITPNLCNDGHDEPCVDGEPGGLVSADAFLREWVPQILDSPAYRQDGLLVVAFDEAELVGPDGDSSACCNEPTGPNTDQPGLNGPGGGRTGAVLLSPRIEAGSTDDTPYNHYSLLCGIEDLFGLDHLGYAGRPDLDCVGADLAP